MSNITTSSIPRLTAENFAEWLVDIRAHLRRSGLWTYIQEDVDKEAKDKSKWEEAADLMTPTLSSEIKRKLTEEEFNNGYRMLARLTALLQPGGEAQFMRLSREYYSLRYDDTKESLTNFLTRLKILEERIAATRVTMNNDKRTLLCLTMALPPRFRSLVQIWTITEGMTADKAVDMLLEEERRAKDDENEDLEVGGDRAMKARAGKTQRCGYCGRPYHTEDHCWTKHPELAPKRTEVRTL